MSFEKFSQLKTAPAIVILGLGGLGLSACSDTDPAARINANFDRDAAEEATCYTDQFASGESGYEGLLNAIQTNPDISLDQVHGTRDAAEGIVDTLDAISDLADSYQKGGYDEETRQIQAGDKYEYCVTPENEVIPGDPSHFSAVR